MFSVDIRHGSGPWEGWVPSTLGLWAQTPTEDPRARPGVHTLQIPQTPSSHFSPRGNCAHLHPQGISRKDSVCFQVFLCKHQGVGPGIFWNICSTPRGWDAQFSTTFNHRLHQILVKSFLNSLQIPLLSHTQWTTPWPDHYRPLQGIPDRMSRILYLVEGDNNNNNKKKSMRTHQRKCSEMAHHSKNTTEME